MMKPLMTLFLLFASSSGWAFPEMIRHGYSRCTVCHVASDGGGVLTPYGRVLSNEVLSTWGEEKESNVAYGVLTLPEWAQLGGDFRVIQTHLDTPAFTQGRTILMQADLELALGYEAFTLVGTVGYQSDFLSRRHYLSYAPSDDLTLRFGKFRKAFGLSTADHVIETERGLGFDQGTETYNLEVAWWSGDFELFVTGQLGRIDRAVTGEQGASLRTAVAFEDTYKAGISYFYGSTSGGRSRHVAGPYAMLGISPDFFILAEVDIQKANPLSGADLTGIVYYTRFD